jgi:hypothetical protein
MMEYISIKNLEKYHPGYKDRTMTWAKIHVAMVHGDPEFELVESEIDKWRFVAMVLLEMHSKKPLPNISRYWTSKGFDLKKRPMSLTLKMLHNFVVAVTEDVGEASPRVEESRVDKNRIDIDKNASTGRNFVPPLLADVCLYVKEKAYSVDPESFLDYYTTRGWILKGGVKMKDWKAAVRTWHKRAEPVQQSKYKEL